MLVNARRVVRREPLLMDAAQHDSPMSNGTGAMDFCVVQG
jgi:hypothetical protein